MQDIHSDYLRFTERANAKPITLNANIEMTKKEQIKNASAKLFRKKGFTATSMQDIAEVVGVKAASLYNHIGSKQEILKDLLINIADAFTKGMSDIENSTLNAIEKLEALIDLHVDLTIKYRDSIALITGEWVHLESPELDKYKKQRNEYEEQFLSILTQCKTDGHIHPKTDIDIALYSILSSLHWLYSWHNKNKNVSRIELAKQLKVSLLRGIVV